MEREPQTVLAEKLAGITEDIDEAYEKALDAYVSNHDYSMLVIEQGERIIGQLKDQAAAGIFAVEVESSRENPIQINIDKLKFSTVETYERVRLAQETLAKLKKELNI